MLLSPDGFATSTALLQAWCLCKCINCHSSSCITRAASYRDSARRSRLRREAQVGEMFEDVDHLTLRATELQVSREQSADTYIVNSLPACKLRGCCPMRMLPPRKLPCCLAHLAPAVLPPWLPTLSALRDRGSLSA